MRLLSKERLCCFNWILTHTLVVVSYRRMESMVTCLSTHCGTSAFCASASTGSETPVSQPRAHRPSVTSSQTHRKTSSYYPQTKWDVLYFGGLGESVHACVCVRACVSVCVCLCVCGVCACVVGVWCWYVKMCVSVGVSVAVCSVYQVCVRDMRTIVYICLCTVFISDVSKQCTIESSLLGPIMHMFSSLLFLTVKCFPSFALKLKQCSL